MSRINRIFSRYINSDKQVELYVLNQTMTMNQLVLITLLLFLSCVDKGLCATDTTYTAAVLEYYPVQNASLTPEKRTVQNVDAYIELLKNNGALLDIAVFPEGTITEGSSSSGRSGLLKVSPIIDNFDGSVIPCDNQEKFPEYFVKLSCAAKELNTYLVANIIEKSVCSTDVLADRTKCADDDYNMFNTNVAFDRKGSIVARYRKFHLFGEYQKNVTQEVEISTFTTDFGVTFGMFICFDILFEEPPLWLVRDGVKHIAFSSMWFSEMPFLTATQVHNMVAVSTDTVLLASGANFPFVGSGGSGIYQGTGGGLTLGTLGLGGSKVFVQEVPKQWTNNQKITPISRDAADIDRIGSEMDNFYLKLDKITVYNTTLIHGNIDDTYCYEDFCCYFKVDLSKSATKTDNFYRYRTFVYSGVRSFDGVYNGGIQVCAVAFCKDDTVDSCGLRIFPYGDIEWATTFNEIVISGKYTVANSNMQYPNTLLSSVDPLGVDSFEWQSVYSEDKQTVEREITLLKSQDRLMTFGIYGRDFSRDSMPTAAELEKRVDLL